MIAWLDSVRADAIFSWRQLNKHKTTSAAAILSLGLAIGACTAAFQLFDALFLKPLPISDPKRLYTISRSEGGFGDGWEYMRFLKMRAAMKGEADLIAVSFPEQTDLAYGSSETVESAYVQYVSGWMFRSFGLRPELGRLLSDDDDREPGAHPIAVLSYDYWTRRFGRNPKVVGSTVRITRKYGIGSDIFEVVGVASKGFSGTEVGTATDVFVPAMMHPLVTMRMASLFRVFVRLPEGSAAGPVHDHLDAFLHALDQQDHSQFPYRRDQNLSIESAAAGVSEMQKNYGQALTAFGVLVALVLLITCSNVANLLSARSAARAREMALRISIGARQTRLMQLVMVECALFAVAATTIGALIAWQATRFVVARINPPDDPARLSLSGDWRVLAVGLALTLIVTLLLGLAPAMQASAIRPASALRGGDNPRARGRLMYSLIGVQAAFCFVALFVSGLFAATLDRLTRQPTGFFVQGLVALDTITPRDAAPYTWAKVAARLKSLPGVESAAVAEWPLLDGNSYRQNNVSINGGTAFDTPSRFLIVSPGWIETMKIPLITGRDFRADESQVALVNQEFVRKYFQGDDPVGKWFEAQPGGQWGQRFLVIGVVGDTRYRKVRDPILPIAYVPFLLPSHKESLIVRISSNIAANPTVVAPFLRQEVSRGGAGFRVTRMRTQQAMLDAQSVRERLLAMLALFFAGVALLLAAVGLYGVLDYSVVQRRREIAIRMAIGAQGSAIVRLVLTKTFFFTLTGALAGGVLSLISVQYVKTLLYEVRPTDWGMITLPFAMIAAAGSLAAVPAVVGAVQVDPANVLRAE